jgi:hypothetical protein
MAKSKFQILLCPHLTFAFYPLPFEIPLRILAPESRILNTESFTVLAQETPKQAYRTQFEPKAGARVVRGGRAVKRVAALASVNLYAFSDLLERFLVGREPAFQVADAELTFRVLFIASTLTGLLFFDGFSHKLSGPLSVVPGLL